MRGGSIHAVLKTFGIGLILLGAAVIGWWLSESVAPGPATDGQAPLASAPEAAGRPAGMAEDDGAAEAGSDEILIRTRREGSHHVVDARIFGPAGSSVDIELVVDTGATVLVLPSSLIDRLGFHADDLRSGRAQTARGVVRTRIGRLDRVVLDSEGDQAASDDVEVAFVRDSHLGGMALLGMSFLGRFRLMIDDAADSITLIERY